MEKFSDRIGVTARPVLAREGMPEALRVALWNKFQPVLFFTRPNYIDWHGNLSLVYDFLHWRSSSLSHHDVYEIKKLETWYFGQDRNWFEIYNLIEFIATQLWNGANLPLLREAFNESLEREGSPYRFVGSALTLIIDPVEMDEVSKAQDRGDRFSGGRQHIASALQFLGLKPEPDYRNAITEAISAVESTLKVLTTEKHLDLSGALKEFVRAHPIHGALVKGLDALYGYTSNEHGLRHALLEADAKVGFPEAKFMIVACAAFMNYLILRSGEP
jgi:hypothetical protein